MSRTDAAENPGRTLASSFATAPLGIAAAVAGFALCCGATLAIGNAPFPILHDMSEAYVWGREFQLGYNQHPPFWAWVCGLWFLLLPRTGWAFALLGALNAGVGLAGAWALIGDFARGAKRQAAFALLLLTPFYTLGCYKYDANTIFLSLWPWTAHFFVLALRSRRSGAAAGFGLMFGLCLLSKYYAFVLLAALLLGAAQTPGFKPWARSPAPWLSAAIAALLCAPHVGWLIANGAPPLRYLHATTGRPFGEALGEVAKTGFSSLASCALALAVVVVFARGGALAGVRALPGRYRSEPDLRLLFALAIGPLALTLIAGLAVGAKVTPEMPIGAFALAPLLMIEALPPAHPQQLARIATRSALALLALMLALSPLAAIGRLWAGGKALKIHPYPEVAAAATRLWRQQVGTELSFVAGRGYEDAVAFYSADRAHSFYGFDLSRNLWVTPERLAQAGLTTVCEANDAECLAKTQAFMTAGATQTRIAVAHKFLWFRARPEDVVVTVIPPRS